MIHSVENATSEILVEDALPVCHSSSTKLVLDMTLRHAYTYLGNGAADNMKTMCWFSPNVRLDDINPNQVSLRIMAVIGSYNFDVYNNKPVSIQLKYLDNNTNTTTLQLYGKIIGIIGCVHIIQMKLLLIPMMTVLLYKNHLKK